MDNPLRLHLVGASGRPWHRVGRVRATGWGSAPDGRTLTGDALAAALDGLPEAFLARVVAFGGDFAAVYEGPGEVVAVVDRVRSIPLFYGRDAAGAWALSDDARWAAAAVGARVDSPLEAAEFMLKSATGGASTLAAGLSQVQAGEAVTLGREARGHRYFLYGAGARLDGDDESLAEQGAAALAEAVERTLASVRGLPLVVPLSGGHDSRLVAGLLAAGGRTDAVCFSYGRPGNPEAEVSRRVAAHLGMPWHFVPYSAAQWAAWVREPDFARFRRDATGLAAIEHEQDWPAVRALRRSGVVPKGAVFLPGHTGDFLAGSNVPARTDPVEADPVAWLWHHYYREWPTAALPPDVAEALRERIRERTAGAATPAEAFARDGWQERQAKMIANAVRAYEHHGCGWRLPFWNSPAALDTWGRMPLDALRGRRVYRLAVRRLLGPTLGAMPTPPVPQPREARWVRLTDRDFGRYGIWLGHRPLLAAVRTRLGSLVRVEHPEVAAVVQALVAPWARLPPQRAGLNALLALAQLNDLADGHPLSP